MSEKHAYERKQTVIIKGNVFGDDEDIEDDMDEHEDDIEEEDEDDENEDDNDDSPENNNSNNDNSKENEKKESESKHVKKDSLLPPNASGIGVNNNKNNGSGFVRRKSSTSMVQEQIQSLMANRDAASKSKDPKEEMEREISELNQDRQLFNDLFEKIDASDNGDLDLQEWLDSLSKVGVEMRHDDMVTIFKYMDIEGNDYVQKDDFVGFCIQKFRSEKLTQLQGELISQIRGNVHSRQPSHLMRPENGDEWEDIEMHAMHREMSQQIVNLATNLSDAIAKEDQFYEEIEKRAREDNDFAKIENASNWSPQEVAWWLDSIDFGQHARKFHEDSVDGSILLNDIDQTVLTHEFGIKPLHVKKILREIDKLRKANKHDLATPYKDWHQLNRENEVMGNELRQARIRIQELEAENARLKLATGTGIGHGSQASQSGFNLLGNSDMSSNNLFGMPFGGAQGMGMQQGGGVGTDTNGGIDPLSENFNPAMVVDKDGFILSLVSDIKSLHNSKMKLAENTDLEIQSLRYVVNCDHLSIWSCLFLHFLSLFLFLFLFLFFCCWCR